MASQLQQQPQPAAALPEIRHAGPAHIRGRIRRVWRPRFLELLDTGQLRYYEINNNNSNNNSNHHELKYTLTVHTARILDGTTLRDLPVGLPRGSFGFLVRGQRHPLSSATTAATLAARHATTTTTTTDEILDEPIRDYWCAVETLEEAQMWVVALQWAASLQPAPAEPWWKVDVLLSSSHHPTTTNATTRSSSSSSSTHCTTSGSHNQSTTSTTQHAPITTTARGTHSNQLPSTMCISSSTDSSSRRSRNPIKPNDDPFLTRRRAAEPTLDRTAGHNNLSATTKASTRREGKILVAKVVRYTVVRLSTWQLEIAYDLECLLVRVPSSMDTKLRNNNNNDNKRLVVEQWTIRRTVTELRHFVRAQVGSSSSSSSLQSVVDRLPCWSQRPSAAQVQQSLSIVDSLLRSWVLSPDVVNAPAFQSLLGMMMTGSPPSRVARRATVVSSSSSSWWSSSWGWPRHDPTTTAALSERRSIRIPAHLNHDQYVKQWLQQPRVPPISWHVHLLNVRHEQTHYRHWLWVGGCAVVVVAAAPGWHRFWQRFVPVVTIRLDSLVVSWMGASYLGHCVGHRFFGATTTSRSRGVRGVRNSRTGSRHGKPPASSLSSNRFSTPSSSSRLPTSVPKRITTPTKTATLPMVHDKTRSVQPDSPTDSAVMVHDESANVILPGDSIDVDADFGSTESPEDDNEYDYDDEASGVSADDLATSMEFDDHLLSSPLPKFPDNDGVSCWSQPSDNLFHVRGVNYFHDKVKVASGPSTLICRGVDIWLTDDPVRHIARHPAVLGGKLGQEDTFLVNFLLPFANFVAYFAIPPLDAFPPKLRQVWTKFLQGDQEYRDARLKLLPYVVDGPWIVKTAVGPGKSPALLGKVIPLQYYFHDANPRNKAVYEVDVIITASAIAKGILSVVKSQTKALTIGFAFIIEAAEQSELPETVLCSFQMHYINLDDCPVLPECHLD